MDIWWKK